MPIDERNAISIFNFLFHLLAAKLVNSSSHIEDWNDLSNEPIYGYRNMMNRWDKSSYATRF